MARERHPTVPAAAEGDMEQANPAFKAQSPSPCSAPLKEYGNQQPLVERGTARTRGRKAEPVLVHGNKIHRTLWGCMHAETVWLW